MGCRIDLLVDIQDSSIQTDEERPARRERLILIDNPVRRRNRLGWIAQQRIINAERLRELLVRLLGVNTDRKMRDVESSNFRAALTERLAVRGSAAGKSFCKPRQDDDLLAAVIGEAIGSAIRAG